MEKLTGENIEKFSMVRRKDISSISMAYGVGGSIHQSDACSVAALVKLHKEKVIITFNTIHNTIQNAIHCRINHF